MKHLPNRANRFSSKKEVFVGRQGAIKRFRSKIATLLDDEELRSYPFMIKGIGGQGKSALGLQLLKMVRQGKIADDHYAFAAQIEFNPKTRDEIAYLIRLRNSLSKAGVTFPAFDLSVLAYFSEVYTDQQKPDLNAPYYGQMKSAVSDVGGGAIDNIVRESLKDIFEGVANSVPILGYFAKKTIYFTWDWAKDTLQKQTIDHLATLFEDGVIIRSDKLLDRLAYLLACDVNLWLENKKNKHKDKQCYGVIFLDEYERLYELGGRNAHAIDRCICDLVENMDRTLFVILTRVTPKWNWDSAWGNFFENNALNLSGLPKEDAKEMLIQHGVTNTEIIEVLTTNAMLDAEHEYLCLPRLVDLQIKHLEQLRATGSKITRSALKFNSKSLTGKLTELVQRMLREFSQEYSQAIKRLSLSSEFDLHLFLFICDKYNITVSEEHYEDFCSQSLIVENDKGNHEVLHIIAEVIRPTLSDQYCVNTQRSLFQYYEDDIIPDKKLRFVERNLNALMDAAHLKLLLDPTNYFDWLLANKKNLFKAGYHRQALELFSMGNDGTDSAKLPNPSTKRSYLIAMAECLCSGQNRNEALDVLSDLISTLTFKDYRRLISSCSRFEDALDWYNDIPQELKSSIHKKEHTWTLNRLLYLSRTKEGFGTITRLYKQLGLPEDSYTIAEHVRRAENFDDAFKIATQKKPKLLTTNIVSLLLLHAKTSEQARQVLRLLAAEHIPFDIIHFNILLNKKNHQEFAQLIEEQEEYVRGDLNIITYTSFLGQVETEDSAVRLYKRMKKIRLKPDSQFYSELFSKAEKTETVLKWMTDANVDEIKFNSYHWAKIAKVINNINDLKLVFQCLIDTKQPLMPGLYAALLSRIKELENVNFEHAVSVLFQLAETKNEKATFNLLRSLIETVDDTASMSIWISKVMALNQNFKMSHQMLIKILVNVESFDEALVWFNYCKEHDISQAHLLPSISKNVQNLDDADIMVDILLGRSENTDSALGALIKTVSRLSSISSDSLRRWLGNLPEHFRAHNAVVTQRIILATSFFHAELFAKQISNRNETLNSKCIQRLITLSSSLNELTPYLNKYLESNGDMGKEIRELIMRKFGSPVHVDGAISKTTLLE